MVLRYIGKGGEQYYKNELTYARRIIKGTKFRLEKEERPSQYPKNEWKPTWTIRKKPITVKKSKRARSHRRAKPRRNKKRAR